MKKQIHLNLLAGLLAFLALGTVGQAQGIQVEKTVTVGKNVPDGSGQLISATTWLNSGIGSVSWVGSTLSFSSPFSNNPIVLSDLSGTLTFGTSAETPVTSTVFSAGQLTSLTQQFTMADAFDGGWKSSGQWTLKIRDTWAGGIARLDSWKLVVEGNSSAAGTTMDLGNGGIVRVASSGTSGTINANVNTGSSGNTATMEVGAGKTLNGMGTVSGSGTLTKTGSGELRLISGAVVSASTISVREGTLLLGAANQIGDSTSVTLSGGTLNTAGKADQVGLLRVTANSTISGLVTSSGGATTESDFLFSGVDLSTYSPSSGSTLTLSGVGYGQSVNFAVGSYTSWGGYNTSSNPDSFNSFQNKISFGQSGLKAQIGYNSGSGLTYVTAIPEPKVYVAMGVLVVLIGAAEYKRRKKAV